MLLSKPTLEWFSHFQGFRTSRPKAFPEKNYLNSIQQFALSIQISLRNRNFSMTEGEEEEV